MSTDFLPLSGDTAAEQSRRQVSPQEPPQADPSGSAQSQEPSRPLGGVSGEGEEAGPPDEAEDICGETFDHDLLGMGGGVWICRRCDAEIIARANKDAAPKRWRRTEFLRSRTSLYGGDRALQDVAAAEAAGVQWLPELPALPERLYFDEDGRLRDEHRKPLTLGALQAVCDAWRLWGPHGTLRAALAALFKAGKVLGANDVEYLLAAPWSEEEDYNG